ncbi:MAG: hypothetical protein EOO43_00605 [Flavobacterium sp.]|nr:MAG: hypothetical protein EOO43_00605 [Flavobacterium sp.]
MDDYEIEYAQQEAIKTYESNLCSSMTRYCKDFTPSIRNFNEIVSTQSITVIIAKQYCKSGKEEKINIEIVNEDTPITMMY